MSIELSKKDKRIIRGLIEKGLQKEFQQGLEQFAAILQRWKNDQQDNKEAYHHLFSSIYDFDKHIAWRYDNMRGSIYIQTVVAQLKDGLISEGDLAELNPNTRNTILFAAGNR